MTANEADSRFPGICFRFLAEVVGFRGGIHSVSNFKMPTNDKETDSRPDVTILRETVTLCESAA